MPNNLAAELTRLAAEVRRQADGGFRLELMRGLRTAAQPLLPAVHNAALRQLPKRGGLNQQVAGQRVTVSVSTSPKSVGLRLKTTAPDTAMTDSGFVRHPTFGRRDKGEWRTQQIPAAAGWWSKTLADKSPGVASGAVEAVVLRVSAKLQAGA